MMKFEGIISQYIKSPAGRAALAAAMQQPLRTVLYYSEPHIFQIVDMLSCEDIKIKEYIMHYVKTYKEYCNLRSAIKQCCPEFEIVLDKILLLK
jgi:hypothetical protein